jgi:DNA-binding MurR/RpiR family transcriptional regulator
LSINAKRAERAGRMAKQRAGGSEDVIDELRRQYDRLTQSQKRIAEYIVDHPDRVAFSTVDQMAGQLGVNPSTIVRFTYRLGLKGFPDLQERTRQLVRGQLSAASEIVNENSVLAHLEGTAFGTSLGQDLQNLRRTISAIKLDDLQRASDMIAAARKVFVVGSFNAYSVAFFLGLALDRIRGNTTVWSGDMTLQASQMLELGPDDCLVAFTSAPYAVSTQRAALLAKEARTKVIEFVSGRHGGRQCAAQRGRGRQQRAHARALWPPRQGAGTPGCFFAEGRRCRVAAQVPRPIGRRSRASACLISPTTRSPMRAGCSPIWEPRSFASSRRAATACGAPLPSR